MDAQQLAEGQGESLGGWIHGVIGGQPIYVKSFEADPHGVRRIAQAAVRECVSEKEIAESIVDTGNWNAQPGEKAKPQQYYQ